MNKINWYEKIAPFYDLGTMGDFFYRGPRQSAINLLNLTSGAVVADIFCGTGVNFPLLHNHIGEKGHILAIDGSEAMLEKAKLRSKKLGLDDTNITFLQGNVSQPEVIDRIIKSIQNQQAQHIFFSLGLTCLENWREFCLAIIDASTSGTRFAILDAYRERLTLGARYMNWIGSADCRRPVWQVLEQRCESFVKQEYWPFKVLDVSVIVASGTKP